MTIKSSNPETLALHAGPRSDQATGAVAVPIVQSTSYQFRSTEHAANLFALKEFGNIYSRIMNPTTDALEQKVAAIEGGVAALAVSSGQAASAMSIQNLCRPGDNIVSSTDLYGGTWNLFANTLPSMGIEVRFADPSDPEAFRKASDVEDPRVLRGNSAESQAQRLSDRRGGEDRAVSRYPAHHGQYGLTHYLPPPGARRRHRRSLDHQVHRWPRLLDRRHDRRRRQLRLECAQGAFPHPQRTRSQLSWRGVDRGREAARACRLHHPRSRCAAARYRRLHEPVQRFPVHSGPRDSGVEDARALPQCLTRSRFICSAIRM